MLSDAELVDGVVAGSDDAFAELYERHSVAARRLGRTVTGNAEDAADAVSEAFARVLVAVRLGKLTNGASFRSYVLTATRNAALDNIRKTSRARPTDQEQLSEVASTSPTPPELLTGDEEATLVAQAFRNLPERWQSVLWLTEVEGVATKDVAQRLGLSPNGTAQLAVRARTGLRERFLQAHLRSEAAPGCQGTVERLGAYVGGGLAPRDLAKVDQHLAGCAPCRARCEELEDLGSCLRHAGIPVPLAVAGAIGTGGSGFLFGAGEKVARLAEWAQQAWATKAAAVATAGALTLGAGGAYVAGSGTGSDELAVAGPAAVATEVAAETGTGSSSTADGADPSATSTQAADTDTQPVSTPPSPTVPAAGRTEGVDPGCTGTDLAAGGLVGIGVEAGSLVKPPNPDDDRAVASLENVLGEAEEGEPPPVDIDLELRMAELETNLAIGADLNPGGGVDLGVDVRNGKTPASDCATGAGLRLKTP